MATILKNSKIKINGEESKWASFGNTLVDPDGHINVFGYDEDGEFWFQAEKGKDLDEPYLNDWWYKVTLGECTEKNHNAPLNTYKWIYRCIQECYDVTQRTIWYKGAVKRFNTLGKNKSGDGILYIPTLVYDFSFPMIERVLEDTIPVMSQHHKGEFTYIANTYQLVCPTDADEMRIRQEIMAKSVAEVDRIIGDLYGFSSSNKPTEVDDKVKVAKVIYDWLGFNFIYGLDQEWEEQSIYAALSKYADESRKRTPVCMSYAYACRYLLLRYGIVNIIVDGLMVQGASVGHAVNMVNYHAELGTYPEDAEQWTYFDTTGKSDGTFKGWSSFNWGRDKSAQKPIYELTVNKYPVTLLLDNDHRYTGYKKYGWDVDYVIK